MLCLAGKKLSKLDKQGEQNASSIKHLDVSLNLLQKGVQLRPFIRLMTLIIDQNKFQSLIDFPVLRDLQTLSANKNNFNDISQFTRLGGQKFSRLKNLSLLKNPLNPYFQSQQKYKSYKKIIFSKFIGLKTLDGTVVDGLAITMDHKEDDKYDRIVGVMVFDQKYADDIVKSVKTRSQGNRFLKNQHL